MDVTPLCGALGAQVDGVDLSAPLDRATITGIRAAYLEHLVLVFRGQRLEPAAQIAFTEIFGAVEPHPLRPRRHLEDYPGVMVLENRPGSPGPRNDFWHSDISHADCPPQATVLYAIEVPSPRGDTMYCNAYRAYEALSDGMRAMLDAMTAIHSGEATARRNNEEGKGLRIEAVPPPCEHPVARTHPETGRKALYVNPFFTVRFGDMTEEESQGLLAFLYETATRPENVYRHRWAPGDLVIWDNRCTMHYAVKDYDESMTRLMHRTTAAGERPC